MISRSFNIYWAVTLIIKIVHLNISCGANKMNNYSSSVITGPTATAGSALVNAQCIYKKCGREELLVALMNSMHKTGIGFREVEDAVAKVQQLKCSNNSISGGEDLCQGMKKKSRRS